ncbi:unnamed protein product, partial [Rotaria sordida]
MQNGRFAPMQKSFVGTQKKSKTMKNLEMDQMHKKQKQYGNRADPRQHQQAKQRGSLEYYDKRYDRITTKTEKKLTMVNRLIHKITTTKDPVIRQ